MVAEINLLSGASLLINFQGKIVQKISRCKFEFYNRNWKDLWNKKRGAGENRFLQSILQSLLRQ